MRITRLQLKNWRNFKSVDLCLTDRVLIFGPNASGKSNLLDAIRFLRDIADPSGGLQTAVSRRGGLSHLRFVNARSFNSGNVSIAVEFGSNDAATWRYELAFTAMAPGKDLRPKVTSERVFRGGKLVYEHKPTKNVLQSSQTAMEQVSLNTKFQELYLFLARVEYLHLVPQIVRDPTRGAQGGRDPFGGTFLAEVGACPQRDWARRRRILLEALRAAVPNFESFDRKQNPDGTWHLEAKYTTFRPRASTHDERDFSDGTLRLLGLLWVLLDKSAPQAPVLLEEPELSLHAETLRVLPRLIRRAIDSSQRQVIATSHGVAMLEDPTVGGDEVVILVPGEEGTRAWVAADDPVVADLLAGGNFNVREALGADLTNDAVQRLMTLKLA